ncbi:hypothetical protein MKX01_026216 [Papaver californicum]|nr:hypothetical protein MKX01_026216 [Papaver californicum]
MQISGAGNNRTKLKRLSKRDQPKPFIHTARRSNRSLVNNSSMSIPDYMSGKICQVVLRSQRLFNRDYIFQEESLCASDGGFSPGFDGNRESMNSSSSDEVSGGPPSPFLNLNVAQVPLLRESMRGNDFSNTVYTTRDYGEKVTLSMPSSESLPDFNILSDCRMLGSSSNNPIPGSKNARVRRPPSIPQSYAGHGRPTPASRSPVQPIIEHDYGTFLRTMTKHYNQWDLVLLYMRQEILRPKSENTELCSIVRALTEELTRVRHDLTDSNAR